MLSTDHNKNIDKSFFAGVVRKMLIIFGDPDCIVLHCLYFLQHKHPVYNCSDTAMSRPFPHSCKQRHQVEAWVDKIQWFVWNCPPEPQPHFFMFGYWCGMWERSVRQESYDFCVSPSLLSFSHFMPELSRVVFMPNITYKSCCYLFILQPKKAVIFTCRYFNLSWNTTALSQSNCRNFSFLILVIREKATVLVGPWSATEVNSRSKA